MEVNQGFKDLKEGSLYVTISIVILLAIVGMAFLRFTLLSLLVLVMELVSYALFVLGLSKLRVGLLRVSETGRSLGNLGTNVFVLGALSLIFSDVYSPLLYLGSVLVAVGNGIVGYAVYKVGEEYKDEKLRLAGVMIIGVLSSVVGYPMCYFASSEMSAKSFERRQTVTLEVSDKSVGYGWLRSTGEAEVTLFSSTEAEIVDVFLLGFPLTQVSTRKLVPGENKVFLKFQIAGSLVPGNVYVAEFRLSDGTVKRASLVYEI
ncbi:MAG: DUF973 family protein [Candidatus Aramenus sp.]|jgi:hypothetical protein|nr:DUF973 family protein [Candidatus Aramenus sp.]